MHPVCQPLSQASQIKLYVIIEDCITSQRRLEGAMEGLSDRSQRDATQLREDIRNYRRVAVGDLLKNIESETMLENIRIIEKAMATAEVKVNNLCLLAGSEDSHSI